MKTAKKMTTREFDGVNWEKYGRGIKNIIKEDLLLSIGEKKPVD